MNRETIARDLQKVVKCEVLYDKQSRDFYSVDASSYLVRPIAIAIPTSEQEIIKILKYASKNGIPIIPRGAGTGLVGSALGNGIILDLKNFDKIKLGSNCVEVGGGVYKGNLDKALGKKDLFFAPNPSIGPFCTVGGMIATNASGSHSLKYGSVIDNLVGVRIITANGRVIGLPSSLPFANKIFKMIKPEIEKKFPAVSKNSCGYRLDRIRTKSDLQKIIAGSEGTLGIIVSAKLRVLPIPRKIMLVILRYESLREAAIDSARIAKIGPSALELVDKNIAKHIDSNLAKNSEFLLFVEFDSNLKKSEKELRLILTGGKIIKMLKEKREVKRWWNYRNSALGYSLRIINPIGSMPTLIEDATVPVEKLIELVKVIERISKKYDIQLVIYGHAGNGNLHVRPVLKRVNKKMIKKIATEFFSQVIRIGGSITGEHGDGLARSEFVKLQYGNEVYSLFEQIKHEFDPKNIFNPDKIITSKSTVTKNLKI